MVHKTKMSSKNFQITSYNDIDSTKLALDSLKGLHFYGFGYEKCPTTGTLHWQGLVCFNRKRRVTGVREDLSHVEKPMHVDILNDTPKHHWETYAKKNYTAVLDEAGNKQLFQWGLVPEAANPYQETLDLVKRGEEHPRDCVSASHLIRHKRSIYELYEEFKPEPKELPGRCGYWIWGATCMGKTTQVRKLAPFTKSHDKFWCSYKNQENVLVNDIALCKEDKELHMLLMAWTEAAPFDAAIKHGAQRMLRPKRVFVTSNYPPEVYIASCGVGQETQLAFLDRFKNRTFNPTIPFTLDIFKCIE